MAQHGGAQWWAMHWLEPNTFYVFSFRSCRIVKNSYGSG